MILFGDWIQFVQREWPLWGTRIILVAFVSAVVLASLSVHNRISLRKAVCIEILVIYLLVLLIVTIFSRVRLQDIEYEINPIVDFSSLWTISSSFRKDIANNIILFLPFGFIIRISSTKKITVVLGLTIAFSISIESLQFILKCGYAQSMDVISNTIGAIIGYLLATLLMLIKKTKMIA